uniref:ABC-three component system protein n=1 Tax=Salibaculum halophilum TaxID=1914408 RepID=UPI0015C46760
PKPEAIALLSKVEVIDLHPNLGDVSSEIEGELIVIDPVQVTAIAQHLEGWWFDVLGKRLVDDKTASIPVQQILMKASEIGKSFGDSALPLSNIEELGAKEYSLDDESETFVRQMRVLELPDSMVERGASDYYKAYAQRSRWARENLILDDELARFDAKLSDRWERKFDEDVLLADAKSSEEEISVGRKLFLWASKDSQPLRNVVETWITAGSYHGLSDRLKIGWHPKFKTLFKTESNDGGS